MLLLLAILLIFVEADPLCKGVAVAKGKPDACNQLNDIAACYAKDGCRWVGTLKGVKKPYKIDISEPKKKDIATEDDKEIKENEVSTKVLTAWEKFKTNDLSKLKIMNYNVKESMVHEYAFTNNYVNYYKGNSKTILERNKQFLIKMRKAGKPSGQETVRRLASFLDSMVNETSLNSSPIFDEPTRRRLDATGNEYTIPGMHDGAPITYLPYCAVGYLNFYGWNKDKQKWTKKKCVAALIRSVEHDGQTYDYVLTAGHCVYSRDDKIDNPTGDDDPRHFKRRFDFYRPTNTADRLTNHINEASKLEEVWIGFWTILGEKEHDWAILKFKQDGGNQDACAGSPSASEDDHAGSYRLVSYKTSKRQEKWGRVVPVAKDQPIYKVTPHYTQGGMSGSPLFENTDMDGNQFTNKLVGVHHGKSGDNSVHKRLTPNDVLHFGYITSGGPWNVHKHNADWTAIPRAVDINLDNRMMDFESVHHKKSRTRNAMDLSIPDHDVNIHHYYHHDHGHSEYKDEHDTYSDGYSEYNYDYEQTKLLLAIPLTLLTICIVCIGCLCCAGFGGIAGWFIQRASKGTIKNRKNDYIQALNDNEVSEI